MITLLLAGCFAPEPSDDPVTVFEAAWTDMDELYGNFDTRDVDWDAAWEEWSPQVTSASDDEALWDALTGMLATTDDGHVQMLRPGERLCAHRHTGSAVYYVVQGAGETIIDGCRFDWAKGDIITLPSWALHEHANLSSRDEAVLFSIQDRPVIDALGLYREEAYTDNGGHQRVLTDFAT